jgi:hypothetical protein
MRALIKKEMVEISWPVAAVFAGLCWAWFYRATFERVLLLPDGDVYAVVVGTAIVVGALLGFLQFSAERWRGTWNFARHRPDGQRNIVIAKALVGVPAMLLLAVGPVLAFGAWQRWTSVNAAVLQYQRLVEYALYGLSGVSAYALGVLASQLRRSSWFDLSVLALACLWCGIGNSISLGDVHRSVAESATLYLLVQGLLTAAFGWLALRLLSTNHDRDISFTSVQLCVLAWLGVEFFVLPASFLAGTASELLRQGMFEGAPAIVRDKQNGEFALMDTAQLDVHHYRREAESARRGPDVDVIYRPGSGARQRDDRNGNLFRPSTFDREGDLAPAWEDLHWHADSYEFEGHHFCRRAAFDHAEGVVRLFWTEHDEPTRQMVQWHTPAPPTLPLERVCAKPDGGQLSPATLILPLGGDEWCFADLQDKTLWKLAPSNFSELFFEIYLPQADRLVHVEPLYSRDMLRRGNFSAAGGNQVLFVGERGSYMWSGGRFEPYTDELMLYQGRSKARETLVPFDEAQRLLELRVAEADPDPIAPRIEIRDASDKQVLFAHAYEPTTGGAKLRSALLYIGALLHMPVGCLYSFATDGEHGEERTWTSRLLGRQHEPLFFHQKRIWLLVSNLALAGLCAVSLARRMKRRRATPTVIALAVAITALTGIFAYVFFRGLMARGNRVPAPKPSLAALPDLLIQSV